MPEFEEDENVRLIYKCVMKQMKEGKVIAIPNAGVKTFVMEL